MVYISERQKWEYRVVTRILASEGLMAEDEINALGAEGWELAGVVSGPESATYYFKRPR